MTVSYPKLFEPNQVDNAALETLYTVPATPATNILRNGRIRFVNTSAGAVTITCHAVPSGGTASATNGLLTSYSIAAYSSTDVDLPIMKAGDFVQAQAGAATSISAHAIDGVLFS